MKFGLDFENYFKRSRNNRV